jgi:electron transport complex protein RnfC
LISRIVTVTGGGVAEPRNIEARLGTPVAELIALAGGYRDDPQRLVMGGPMMGVALANDELPITAATNCLWVATANEIGPADVERPCIRCGACIEVCPAGLLPQELLAAARGVRRQELTELGLDACIECGACDYVCPSHIPLTTTFVQAKADAESR